MRVLQIHATKMEYRVTKAIKNLAEEIPEEKKSDGMEECVTAFISVEKKDEENLESVVAQAVESISTMAEKVNTRNIMLYPYAHLSSELAGAKTAVEALKSIEEKLKEEGYTVKRSPFGWYKAFTIECKGHPLSELSRELKPVIEGEAEFGKKAEGATREEITAQIESRFIILTPEGEELEIDMESMDNNDFLDKYPSMKKFVKSEVLGIRPSKEPPSIKAMQRLELVDYEKATDAGHFRFYPKGSFIFRMLEALSRHICVTELGAMEIDTPIMYDWEIPEISGQAKSFHERHYNIHDKESGKTFVLRFAGDFGLFRMMADGTISYRHLPVRMFEFSKSFRKEQRGELSGLKRLRGFHMPDLHTFARDVEQGWDEYKEIYRKYAEYTARMGIEYVVSFRIVKEFYERYRDHILELVAYTGQPAMIEIINERKHYWVVKNEFQGIDSTGDNLQLGTVQLDVEDASRYGITFTDEDGSEKGCIITHSSIGSIERWIYIILEEALKKEKAELPFWLAPTQVRLIPVKPDLVRECEAIADYLNARVDIDDRDESVGKRIREAEREWVPLIVVFGDKEKESGKLPVRTRNGETMEMGLKELQQNIRYGMQGWPYLPLPLPRLLSRRMKFRG